jgi:hypothetical protein
MAIKGKGKTKERVVARAPRREPVAVKPPVFARRRVQVAGAFVLGVLTMMFLVWVTNGLREQDRSERARVRQAAVLERTRGAVDAWRIVVEGEVNKIGAIQPGLPPMLLPAASAALDGLAAGSDVKGAAATLSDAQRSLTAAIDTIDEYGLADEIRGLGFDNTQTNYLLNSKSKMIEALQLYRQAVALGRRSLDGADGLGEITLELRDQAATMFARGWGDLDRVKESVGIDQTPGDIAP